MCRNHINGCIHQVYPTPGEVSVHEYLLAGWGMPIGMLASYFHFQSLADQMRPISFLSNLVINSLSWSTVRACKIERKEEDKAKTYKPQGNFSTSRLYPKLATS